MERNDQTLEHRRRCPVPRRPDSTTRPHCKNLLSNFEAGEQDWLQRAILIYLPFHFRASTPSQRRPSTSRGVMPRSRQGGRFPVQA